ncbi:RNA-binding protein 20 isoform X2 [Cyprinodon tularosa]|uniref:RNA-binding protein 20 isoform X2 n=1 Tax=Cyprinodon tularosa TaxID=77115 RepID=UPI0018E26F97|nr:RNA-binding protein 20 isoform X2 [Cyprinodon tularosa]
MQAWDWTRATESVKTSQTKMLGKGQCSGYVPEMNEALQSIRAPSLDSTEKKGHQAGVQLPGNVQTGPQQQNQLLLTPASLQLAQLQAQLTLHRLKLAQEGNTANAASILNQLISNVNMSQPMLNQLRNSSLVGIPQGAFPTRMIGFPSSNSVVGTLVGGGFNQNSGNVRLDHPGGGGGKGQHGGEYGKKPGSAYSSGTDRCVQYSLPGGTSAEEQYTGIQSQAKNMNNVGFHRDFYGQDMQAEHGFISNEQMNSTAHKEQWKGHNNLNQTGTVNMPSSNATARPSAGQPIWLRTELYNPEEPTPEPKLNCYGGVSSFGSSSTQGFGIYQALHGAQESLPSATRTLQPHQVSDYCGVTPSQLPHQCSICDKKVYNLKDWDQHVKGKLHLQNRTLYAADSSTAASAGAPQYAVGRSSEGSLNTGGTNATTCPKAGQDVCSETNVQYLPAGAMKTYPSSDGVFASHQPDSTPFPPRKASAGRVVHICNLPEGSCTENDVINLGIPFGKVTNYILMRSTHQAFLEMAYVEAAKAMVQYYQLNPATINNQKLLIRMSKRYKELQLKKPGKDVQSIIQDITSQQERDKMQEFEHYLPDRARSRSPISRSLSPHSHSPSFTSCSSAHSPPVAPCRGPDRGSNGLSPHRGSRDWPSHMRRGEEERERDDPWRNGGNMGDNQPNGRTADRRRNYHKHLGHPGFRSADGHGSGEAPRSSREWHQRDSPLGSSFSSYRNMEDDLFMESSYKSGKPPRTSHHRHDTKSRRRDGDHSGRSRHSEFETTDGPRCRTPEDKRQSSSGRDRSKNPSKRHTEKQGKENGDDKFKENSVLPQQGSKSKEATESDKNTETNVVESVEDTDEECWYPKNMEELVTVDEVGGEDDNIVEPDISELEEFTSCHKKPTVEELEEKHVSPSTPPAELQEPVDHAPKLEESSEDKGVEASKAEADKAADITALTSLDSKKANSETTDHKVAELSSFPNEEFKAALEETCSEDTKFPNNEAPDEPMENHVCLAKDNECQDERDTSEKIPLEVQLQDANLKREIEAPSPSLHQDKAVSELSIPLGVEFIEPRTGFYCKLCGLFYTSEDAAKTTHCRSTVHYRNLQKYLSQLAETCLSSALTEAPAAH